MTKEQYNQMRFEAACAAMTGLIARDRWSGNMNLIIEWADSLLKELGIEEPKE